MDTDIDMVDLTDVVESFDVVEDNDVIRGGEDVGGEMDFDVDFHDVTVGFGGSGCRMVTTVVVVAVVVDGKTASDKVTEHAH